MGGLTDSLTHSLLDIIIRLLICWIGESYLVMFPESSININNHEFYF
jgi:hypothetical protein